MKVQALKCINCGAALEIEDGIDTFFCKYCGYKIILEDISEASINAKVQLKKMEHQERMRDKQYEQERYKFDKKEKHKKNETNRKLKTGVIAILAGILVLALFSGASYVKSIKEEQQLQAKVDEIMIDIDNGDYDKAYIKANSLHYTADWSSEIEDKWDNTRKALLEKIEKAEKRNSDNNDGDGGFFNWFK
jgi:DNA-directed RNA polymerase subunit RPC12/RpoP